MATKLLGMAAGLCLAMAVGGCDGAGGSQGTSEVTAGLASTRGSVADWKVGFTTFDAGRQAEGLALMKTAIEGLQSGLARMDDAMADLHDDASLMEMHAGCMQTMMAGKSTLSDGADQVQAGTAMLENADDADDADGAKEAHSGIDACEKALESLGEDGCGCPAGMMSSSGW